MLKPRPNGRARRARASQYEREYVPKSPTTCVKIVSAVRAQQHAVLTPTGLERALTFLNQYFNGAYALKADWSSGRGSGGVLACTRRRGKLVRGRHGVLRIRLEFEDWRRDVPELVPYGWGLNSSVFAQERLSAYHRIQLEADPEVRPWNRGDVRRLVPALCSALGLDPVGTKGIRKVRANGLPDTARSLPMFEGWAPPPRPKRTRLVSGTCSFKGSVADVDHDREDVAELLVGCSGVRDSDPDDGFERPRLRNPLDGPAEDSAETATRFKVPSTMTRKKQPKRGRGRPRLSAKQRC